MLSIFKKEEKEPEIVTLYEVSGGIFGNDFYLHSKVHKAKLIKDKYEYELGFTITAFFKEVNMKFEVSNEEVDKLFVYEPKASKKYFSMEEFRNTREVYQNVDFHFYTNSFEKVEEAKKQVKEEMLKHLSRIHNQLAINIDKLKNKEI